MKIQEDGILEWIQNCKIEAHLKCISVPLNSAEHWDLSNKHIEHSTKRFFSIVGVKARSAASGAIIKEQPLINQPEIGILGFIIREKNDQLQILLQAKTEPGNVGGTQIAPTVQATYSNYMQVHEGKPTKE